MDYVDPIKNASFYIYLSYGLSGFLFCAVLTWLAVCRINILAFRKALEK